MTIKVKRPYEADAAKRLLQLPKGDNKSKTLRRPAYHNESALIAYWVLQPIQRCDMRLNQRSVATRCPIL